MKSGIGRKMIFLYCGKNLFGNSYGKYTPSDVFKYAKIGNAVMEQMSL